MPDDAIDVVRRYHEALAGRDRDAIFALLTEDIEFRTVESPLDLDEVYRGHEGMRRMWRQWRSAWDSGESVWEVEEMASNGDKVFVCTRERARAKATGAGVEQRWYQVQTVRDGRICRWQMFLDRDAARAAAELDQPQPEPVGALRDLPAVDELAGQLGAPHPVAVSAARAVLEERRSELLADAPGESDLVARARDRLTTATSPSLRPVLNATGVIIHTNLGRAPLAPAARDAVARLAAGYSNLELDLEAGRRGSRQAHVEGLLAELTGAESGLAVNNCAGAVLLATAALAGPGRSVIVSRGQAVEIGGSFRIPEVVAQSGARLVEVGTTNRTRLEDYAQAIDESTGAILRAHPSNFRTLGFVEQVEIEQLCGLGPPVIDDIGSGALAGGVAALRDEPPVGRSVLAGAALVCFSADKLLGGPQAGLLVGRADSVSAARSHPLARALRIDKLSLAALEATLRLYHDPERARREIPVLAMLEAGQEELGARAQRLRSALAAQGVRAQTVRAVARVGGGALPLLELEGPAVAVDPPSGGVDALAARLRRGDPPVIGRIHRGRLLLDPRTLTDEETALAAAAVTAALPAQGDG